MSKVNEARERERERESWEEVGGGGRRGKELKVGVRVVHFPVPSPKASMSRNKLARRCLSLFLTSCSLCLSCVLRLS